MHYSKSDSVEQALSDQIKIDIISKKFTFGAKISETELAQKYNVSRTPIRGALKQLANVGLVTLERNKGVHIYNPNLSELKQLIQARSILENEAVKIAIENVSSEMILKMRTLIAEENQCYIERDMDRYISINNELHMCVARATNNEFLIKYIDELMMKTSVYMRFFDTDNFQKVLIDHALSIRQHREFYNAMRDNEWEKAKNIWCQHSTDSFSSILKAFLEYLSDQNIE